MLRMPDPQGEHQPVQTGSAPEQLAWGWLVPRMYLALWELWRGLGVALGWLWGRNRLAINTLWGGFRACHDPQVRRAQISAAVWQAGLPPRRGHGAYLRFSKSTGFSTVAEDRGEGALVASRIG